MTCIVGIEKDGRVYLGGDRAAVSPWMITDAGVSKVFKKGKIIAGYSGSFRFGQLLQYAFTVPKQKDGQDVMEFMCVDFIDSLRTTMKDRGLAKIWNNVEDIGWSSALIGYQGALYELDGDLQIRPRQIASVGSGFVSAMGVLNYLMRNSPRMRPETMLAHALTTAADITGSVCGPFDFVKARKPRV